VSAKGTAAAAVSLGLRRKAVNGSTAPGSVGADVVCVADDVADDVADAVGNNVAADAGGDEVPEVPPVGAAAPDPHATTPAATAARTTADGERRTSWCGVIPPARASGGGG